jgi:hypothetical protein
MCLRCPYDVRGGEVFSLPPRPDPLQSRPNPTMPSIPCAWPDICVGLEEAPPARAAPAARSEPIVSQAHSRSPAAAGAIGSRLARIVE